MRFSFTGQTIGTVETDLLYLALTTLGTVFISALAFKFAMYQARKNGLIDRKEEY
jgi:hypothetical protein